MAAIPNRAVFRSQEVCEIAEVQPYVLKSWEAEFPDLGMSKSAGAPRVYRRADVERVLRIKQLVFVDGLTLAGARRQLSEEDPAAAAILDEDNEETVSDSEMAALLDREVRKALGDVRSGLHGILVVLNGGRPDQPMRFMPAGAKRAAKKAARSARPGKTVRSAGRSARSSRVARPARSAKKSPAKRRR
jgi:DNA-binding transcriptional MerR regulator